MKHRYTVTLAIAFAALYPALDGIRGSTAAALKTFGAKDPEAGAKGAVEIPIEFSIERDKELTDGELATLRAAIESDYSRVGAVVTKVVHHGRHHAKNAPTAPPVVSEAPTPAPRPSGGVGFGGDAPSAEDDEEAARESAAAAGGTLETDEDADDAPAVPEGGEPKESAAEPTPQPLEADTPPGMQEKPTNPETDRNP